MTAPPQAATAGDGHEEIETCEHVRHQNHHPRPTLNELGATMTELRLRMIE